MMSIVGRRRTRNEECRDRVAMPGTGTWGTERHAVRVRAPNSPRTRHCMYARLERP